MVDSIARALGQTRSEAPASDVAVPCRGRRCSRRTSSRCGIQPPLHRRRLDFFRKTFVFSTDKAQSLLGFVPKVNFAEGARETAAWYRDHGYLSPAGKR